MDGGRHGPDPDDDQNTEQLASSRHASHPIFRDGPIVIESTSVRQRLGYRYPLAG
jgi:hypothetical protein